MNVKIKNTNTHKNKDFQTSSFGKYFLQIHEAVNRERQLLEQEHDWQLKQERENLGIEHRHKVKQLQEELTVESGQRELLEKKLKEAKDVSWFCKPFSFFFLAVSKLLF